MDVGWAMLAGGAAVGLAGVVGCSNEGRGGETGNNDDATRSQVRPPSRVRQSPWSNVPAKTRSGSRGSTATHWTPRPSRPIETCQRCPSGLSRR